MRITTAHAAFVALVLATSCYRMRPSSYGGRAHPLGEGGLGPPINNKDLPGFALKAKVRTGLGLDMPHFSTNEISDLELDDLVDYMKALRRNHH